MVTRDHPRVCGEKSRVCPRSDPGTGSPPRMRGKGSAPPRGHPLPGITPAYAGKSTPSLAVFGLHRDHPRVCGEKQKSGFEAQNQLGSPPRMRGKGLQGHQARCRHGITPAYAGKRAQARSADAFGRDHPRVCGEKLSSGGGGRHQPGSPPRMRGKAPLRAVFGVGIGITPAYAGKSA